MADIFKEPDSVLSHCGRKALWEHVHFHTFDSHWFKPRWNISGASAPSNPVPCWLIKCPPGVLWCSCYSVSSLRTRTFLWHYLRRCCLYFFLLVILKELAVALCRRLASLLLTMQPVMNSILLYLVCGFITASRCWKPSWHRASCVQPFLFMQQRKIPLSFVFFPLSSNFMPESFQRRSFAHVSAALSQACIADMCHIFIYWFFFFCRRTGMCALSNLDGPSAFPEAWPTDFSAPSRSS